MARRIKICPSCNQKQGRLDFRCSNCGASMAGVHEVTELDTTQPLVIKEDPSQHNNTPNPAHLSATVRLSEAKATLECFDQPSTVFEIIGSGIVGRGAETDLTPLPRAHFISRQHARIINMDGCWYVEDLGSSSGTWHNEKRLVPNLPERLAPGSRITLGNTTFRFQVRQ